MTYEKINFQLKELLEKSKVVQMPVAHDALSAKLIERAGFEVVGVGGFGVSASLLGKPDMGNLELEHMTATIKNIRQAINIPIIADGETGYGDISMTVRTYEEAGASCIFLEDQLPEKKRCGHMEGKDVISKEKMCENIKLALESRVDKNFLIAARTDSLAINGIEDAIDRAKTYKAVGADIIFIEAIKSVEQLKRVGEELKGNILFANMLEHGKTPLMTADELGKMNYRVIVYPTCVIFSMAKASQNVLRILRESGTTKSEINNMMKFYEFVDMLSD